MQTVNFRCGNCNKLMAVGTEFLGGQVRCPHCQSVVATPAPAPFSPAPSPAREAPAGPKPFDTLAEGDDIFSPPAAATDSLFDEPAASRLELPPPPAPPFSEPLPAPSRPDLGSPLWSLPAPPTPQPSPFAAATEPTGTHAPMGDSVGAPTGLPSAEAGYETGSGAPPWTSPPPADGHVGAGGEPAGQPPTAPRKLREAAGKVNWFIPLVFLPLLLYAILATAAVAYMYILKTTAPPSMFDQIPDVDGDTPGVRPAGKGAWLKFDRKGATQPLPKHLHVGLKSTLTVGALEVTPTRLERRHVRMFNEKEPGQSYPLDYESLVLHLRLKNRADYYAFTPLDNYFDRKWVAGKDLSVPLTLLEAGPATYFGGPAHWHPLKRDRSKDQGREWLEGRKDVDLVGLAPGETTESYVCTDGEDPAVQRHLFGLDENGKPAGKPYAGPLLWRVQLRRGLVPHRGRQLPATAVIGVEFTGKDVPTGRAPPGEA